MPKPLYRTIVYVDGFNLICVAWRGQAKVTPQDLLKACLRFRLNRIIMGELRGVEAFTYLEAINSGHPGSVPQFTPTARNSRSNAWR